ncbi:probable ATP-dependent DNA helicase RecQ [Saccostrea cucullata]|uniref:probable ATP-dependent DNA helicase RecQ n=1 Tax=Saccostrea cuccullata TaxID=36930 RepID=UPI002ED38937
MDEKDIVETFNSLKQVYKFQFTLKDEQMSVLLGTMNKRNTFALLPTGYGKSMCFTLPPLLLDELDWTIQHISVVVSPLKSLMADQVNSLTEMGVRALAISPEMQHDTYKDIKQGKYSIVFISPESATSKFWRDIFLSDDFQKRICLLACDEAHCISEW